MNYNRTFDFKVIKKNKNRFPLHLYHYYSFDEKKYYEDILLQNKLYFSSPKQFNDPYDCSFDMSFVGRKQNIKKHLSKIVLPKLVENPDQETKTKFDEFVDQNWDQINPNNPDNEKRMREKQKTFKEKSGIYCLIEENDNILMWSHYAIKHSGFCVEFDFSGLNNDIVSYNKENNLFLHLESIDYAKNYPKLSGYKDNDMIRALFTKSFNWKYENEWRIFYSDGEAKKVPLSLNTISAICLGISIDDQNEEKVKSILKQKKSNIRLFKAYKSKNKFEISFERIEY